MRHTKASHHIKQLRWDRQALCEALCTAGANIASQEAIRCPFHNDVFRSGKTYPSKCGAWRYRCKSCGFRGDLFDVRAKHEDRPVGQILREYAEKGRSSR